MFGIVAEIINRRFSDCRVLNWIVLLSFLLNVSVFLGYEWMLPYFLTLSVPSGTDCASLAEYTSIALAPIFLVDLASWMRFVCSWKKSSGKSDGELMAARFGLDPHEMVERLPWIRRRPDCLGTAPFGQSVRRRLLGAHLSLCHWNHVRHQRRLKGLTPVEFREQALREAT